MRIRAEFAALRNSGDALSGKNAYDDEEDTPDDDQQK
jgi:hypothetical protein